ncbi:MAG: ChaN family lipoprotein [Chromatiaceae bacterium]|nr:ChaN family lipoprotein [Chromatiaceae bacterium]MCP5313959.1 ChaN family lipoprotein [Chromatiaceae bacterium]
MFSGVLAESVAASMEPIVVEAAKTATLPDLMTSLQTERVVYVGETHNALSDHLLQLDVLRGMAERPGGLALGVEWFQKPFQGVLDEYLAGAIDEAEMLRRTEYFERWKFDYRLYRPIIEFAKEKGIPILALNAAKELTGEIRRVGLDQLSDDFRAQLPSSYDFDNQAYEQLLRDIFRQHQSNDQMFRKFLQVQLTWDESMAEGVGNYLKANPEGRILVLAGRGHIAERHGIPSRVTRRTGLEGKTVSTYSLSSDIFNATDYMVLTAEKSLPPAGLMHVFLDDRGEGVVIEGFSDRSPAKAAGLKKGDRILSINGQTIERFPDVKIAMIDQRPGSEIELEVQRRGFFGRTKTVSLKVRLVGEAMLPGH